MKRAALLPLLALWLCAARAEDGYRLWLRYDLVDNKSLLEQYRMSISSFQFNAESNTLVAARNELLTGLHGLLGAWPGEIYGESGRFGNGCLIVGTSTSSPIIGRLPWKDSLQQLGDEGFMIRTITLDGKK
jgi:alpha-glucuronidase